MDGLPSDSSAAASGGLMSCSSCSPTPPLMTVTGQFSGCAGLMLSRLYALPAGPSDLWPPGRCAFRFVAAGSARYSRYLVRLPELNARGIHHWGGLDTFDPYVLH